MIVVSINSKIDFKKLYDSINEFLKQKNDWKIISVDGPMQSGKSTYITPELVKYYKAEAIDLDSYISIDENSIIYKKDFQINNNKKYIADGVLNREILNHFKLSADLNIYVKKMANFGWAERDWLDIEIVKDYGLNKSFSSSNIDRQIFRYHNEYKPVENADIVIEIAEEFVTSDFPR